MPRYILLFVIAAILFLSAGIGIGVFLAGGEGNPPQENSGAETAGTDAASPGAVPETGPPPVEDASTEGTTSGDMQPEEPMSEVARLVEKYTRNGVDYTGVAQEEFAKEAKYLCEAYYRALRKYKRENGAYPDRLNDEITVMMRRYYPLDCVRMVPEDIRKELAGKHFKGNPRNCIYFKPTPAGDVFVFCIPEVIAFPISGYWAAYMLGDEIVSEEIHGVLRDNRTTTVENAYRHCLKIYVLWKVLAMLNDEESQIREMGLKEYRRLSEFSETDVAWPTAKPSAYLLRIVEAGEPDIVPVAVELFKRLEGRFGDRELTIRWLDRLEGNESELIRDAVREMKESIPEE